MTQRIWTLFICKTQSMYVEGDRRSGRCHNCTDAILVVQENDRAVYHLKEALRKLSNATRAIGKKAAELKDLKETNRAHIITGIKLGERIGKLSTEWADCKGRAITLDAQVKERDIRITGGLNRIRDLERQFKNYVADVRKKEARRRRLARKRSGR